MSITIREHTPGRDVGDFIRAGHVVFEGDPTWVPPLDFELRERLHPRKNPFFQRAEVTLFTAWKDGRLVGRCSAQVDHEHLKVWHDDTGFFGFFDTIDDDEVGKRLIDAAADWLVRRGMKRMMGPFSLYVNEEVGILIEGFETPPVLMMAHSRRYQAKVAEAAGLVKEKDLFAWRYGKELTFPDRVLKAWQEVKKLPEVRLRSVDPKQMQRETRAIMDIYNDAWAGKWAMVPALPEEVTKVAKDLSLIIDPDLAFIAEVDGRPSGMCIMLPNINEAIHDLRGKLLPTGALKLLYRLKWQHPKSTRLMMLGIRKDITRNMKRYGGLSAAMYVEVAKRGIAKGYEWGELSWTREDDRPINLGIRSMGAEIYKKYRVYQKPLVQAPAPRPSLDPAFVADCAYGPGGLLIDEILDIDAANHFVRARMPTHDDLPLTREQRAHPVLHPRHVSGGLMVHMTGMIAYVHAYYVLGLHHADGWVGYGAKIYTARFHALAKPGEPLILECKATRVRKGDPTVFARYTFRFLQGDKLIYEGEQSAVWTKVTVAPPA